MVGAGDVGVAVADGVAVGVISSAKTGEEKSKNKSIKKNTKLF